ncbi:MAG: PPOX class F420-dependent oxidoreductase [Dehalococcoidia bacterium]|jgi:PPOX class probable F420-dependent enzyme|uniref:PPOX class F420-dependent oxidoreductase n=1 Tax=Candidatus Amarobacter glycogenicus TaxID=3140699 RepID=UPI001D9396C5|nr:PPOX class F420-dependent oxidoreductase [Dehalococcoidia bacterium]MBK6560214.1 PPOX class F420-dependent oxidoreductase [Dehalococcoidia bacterium]MBK7125814.1 PPOX class F420-dependent oxidoreductase [Dehalococcoidia bacterium]MBK7724176.1 PPOX class F420-dependent oxidoreductase [Dehalococcoidia bacterium]MBK8559390.1 PPOX class F420-dependent oxidoreductase [Dehalococcoidia bacterium]
MLRELTPEVRAFLEEAKWPGVLSTLGPNGAPITSAVWFALVGDDIVISTPASRPKARNARLDARVSFIVDTKERPYKGVAIEGTAAVIDDPARQSMRTIAERYLGPALPPAMEERIAATERVMLKITPSRIRPWGFA